MIDYGLLMSVIVAFGTPSLLAQRWPIISYPEPVTYSEVALAPAFIGLLVGRVVAVTIDDPRSLLSLSDLLIVRSGVEFWPGIAAAALALLASARMYELPLLTRVAALAPLSMFGYAAYELACLFRDGCYGPASPRGLTPPGTETTMLPIGLIMAAAIASGALLTHRLERSGATKGIVVLTALAWVAVVRAVGSVWLPHVGEGLTRQHLTSIAIAAISVTGWTLLNVSEPGSRANRRGARAEVRPSEDRP